MSNCFNPQESYDKFCNEYFFLFKRTDLTKSQKNRVSQLFRKIEELEAVYFGNPKGLQICTTCGVKVVRGYYGNGIYLDRTCPYCFRRNGKEVSEAKRNNPTIGHKYGAKS